MNEIWRDIKDYEGLYQVSNLGRVRSLNYRKGRILKPGTVRGYSSLSLCKDGCVKQKLIHRLVAETFIHNPYNLPQVNHKDENKSNNCVDNLEWCTGKFNTRFSQAKKVGCFKNNKLLKVYNAIVDVNNDGFYNGNVIKCCKGKRKTHKGYTWRYLEDEN